MIPIDQRDSLAQAHALEHSAMLIAHMDEQAMRSAIIWHQKHQEQIAELLAAAKELRTKHEAEVRAALAQSSAAPSEGSNG